MLLLPSREDFLRGMSCFLEVLFEMEQTKGVEQHEGGWRNSLMKSFLSFTDHDKLRYRGKTRAVSNKRTNHVHVSWDSPWQIPNAIGIICPAPSIEDTTIMTPPFLFLMWHASRARTSSECSNAVCARGWTHENAFKPRVNNTQVSKCFRVVCYKFVRETQEAS